MKKIRFTLLVLFLLCLGISAMAQTKITLKGEVVDKDNQPVIGASIIEIGTTNGTVTNIEGKFSINVTSAKAKLRVSCIGYEKLETLASNITLTGRIKLQESAVALNEVVAIGYGVVKKNDATGSVTAIKPDKMNKGLTLNAQDMIIGKVAGVQVITGGGTPGSGATIRIRGGSSLNASNDPLIVIDGLAMDNDGIKGVANPLSTINPNDIESFTVLKDASATAIYGSRASNGVIIITTKKGQKGQKTRVSYDGTVSLATIAKKYKVLSGDDFKSLAGKLFPTNTDVAATNSINEGILANLGSSNTDWQSQIYQNALSHDHNISIMGATKNTPFRFSAGYTNQDGIIKTSNFERFIGAVNLSPSLLRDHLKLNLNAKGMYVRNQYADGGVVGSAASFDPTQSVKSDAPTFAPYGGYFQWRALNGNTLAMTNPVATLEQKSDRATSRDFIGNAEADYKVPFLPEMHLHLNLAMESSYGIQRTNVDTMAVSDFPHGRTGWDETYKTNKSLSYFMQYIKEINKHKFDAMAGYEWQHFHRKGQNEWRGAKLEDINNDGKIDANEYYNPILTKNTAWATENFLISFFGRLNYSYADRYLFTATLRNDRSSRFSAENRSAMFPSFAFAWKVNEEGFLKEYNIVSDLKVRLGYGVTGQQDIGLDYQYMPVYTTNKPDASYQFGDSLYNTSRPESYISALKWEETTTYNAGIDFGFLNSRFTGSIDYYYRRTDNLLYLAPVAAGVTFRNKATQNIGTLENKGLEITLNAKIISTKDWGWELGYNYAINRNFITKLAGANDYQTTGGTFQGPIQAHGVNHPAYSFWVYKQKYDANGKMIEAGTPKLEDASQKYSEVDAFEDLSKDGKINDDDRYFDHSANPDYIMGLSSKLNYKGFDLGFTIRASIGNYMYNAVESGGANVSSSGIWNNYFSNKTQLAVDNNLQGQSSKTYISDHYIQNASFLRCDNITLGYSFKKLFNTVSNGRLYTAVQNPFVITSYKGLDPEINQGIDSNIYPRPRTFIVGLSLNF